MMSAAVFRVESDKTHGHCTCISGYSDTPVFLTEIRGPNFPYTKQMVNVTVGYYSPKLGYRYFCPQMFFFDITLIFHVVLKLR